MNNISLKGSDIITGGSIIIPALRRTLAITRSTTKKGINKSIYHIYLKNSYNQIIEIAISNTDQQFITKKCEIFGDKITGLNSKDLEKILKVNPAQKFIPI